MEPVTKLTVERALGWSGPLFVITMTYTWGVMGHNIPPPNMMAMTPDQLISEYYGKYPEIGAGMIASATFGMFYTVWSCLLAKFMREEDNSVGVLSFIELSGGILTGWLFAFCSAMWAACSVLVGQVQPDVIKMVHTFTWFIFDCTYMITTIQMVALGLYTVLNKQQKIFPAWAGWLSIAIGVGFVPLVFMPFVKDGPFVVPGLWNFWVIFPAWLLAFFSVYNFYLLKHLYRS
jgi:hypothetical protein